MRTHCGAQGALLNAPWGPEWEVQREGMHEHGELIHFAAQQKLTQHCKATIPQ